jgi:DUF2934 family protein
MAKSGEPRKEPAARRRPGTSRAKTKTDDAASAGATASSEGGPSASAASAHTVAATTRGAPAAPAVERFGAGQRDGAPERDAIAHRAYEIYKQRGGSHGRDLDDWLRAEHEIRERGKAH